MHLRNQTANTQKFFDKKDNDASQHQVTTQIKIVDME